MGVTLSYSPTGLATPEANKTRLAQDEGRKATYAMKFILGSLGENSSLEEKIFALTEIKWSNNLSWKQRFILLKNVLLKEPSISLPLGYSRVSHYLTVALPLFFAKNCEESSPLNWATNREVIQLQGECLAQFGGEFSDWRKIVEEKLMICNTSDWDSCLTGIRKKRHGIILPDNFHFTAKMAERANRRKTFWLLKENTELEEPAEQRTLTLLTNYRDQIAYPPTRFERLFPKRDRCFLNGKLPYFSEFLFPEGPLFSWEAKELTKKALSTPDLFDTLFFSQKMGLSFEDDEIDEILPITKSEGDQYPLMGRLKDGQPVYLQRGIRGCQMASIAMLLSYALKKDVTPRAGDLGEEEDLLAALDRHNIEVVRNFRVSIDKLKELLEKYGPAESSVHTLGSHVVIVDEVRENGIALRDPFHGWQVVVKTERFIQRGGLDRLIQAKVTPP